VSRSWTPSVLASSLAIALAGTAAGQEQSPRADWPTYGGSYGQQRFSRLTQVSTTNVRKLRVAWTYAVPDAGQDDASLQVTPLVVRGRDAGLPAVDAVMLVTSPLGRVIALDASSGQPLWEFAPPLREPLRLCCSKANRGPAFGQVRTGSGAVQPRVYVTTLDARLWALSSSTGQPVPDFGDGAGPAGSVAVADNSAGYSLMMAPLFISRGDIPAGGRTQGRDLVVVGSAGADYEIRGSVTAYDALSGERVWRFFTVPGPDDFGGDTWPVLTGPFADPFLRGGGGAWMTPAYDAASGRLFVAVGNPAPNLEGTHRAGSNLFTDSIVALDVRTGSRVWHFQQVHHDIWDYDPSSPPLLFDVGERPAVAEAGKTGFLYILDRDTGAPIFPCPETAVPPSDVVAPDGSAEMAWPTQPVCPPGLQFVPLLRPGETPIHAAAGATLEPIFTPPSKGGTHLQPAVYGGAEWSPVASHPELGLAFIAAVVQPADYFAAPERRPRPGKFGFGGLPLVDLFDVSGTLTAIDVSAGTVRWQNATKRPLVGGALATAGGVVFYGEGGPRGGAFVGVDAETGKELFRFKTRGGVNAAPMTFLANGKQLVAVAAGGHRHYLSRRDNLLVAFALR
jgi:quinohemoprotein ethanol dehydrogenase